MKIINQIIHKISNCKLCDLYNNGRAKPYIGDNYKYIIIAEAPGEDEIVNNTPLVGRTGKQLFEYLNSIGFNRDDFIILNACNCRPVIINNNKVKNGKPTEEQMKCCYKQNMALIYYSDVERIITLGDYAKYLFERKLGGISNIVGSTKKYKIKNKNIEVTFNYHPSYAFIYNKKALDKFKVIFEDFLK